MDTAFGMTLEDCKKLFGAQVDNNEIGDKVGAVEEVYNEKIECQKVCLITDPYDKLQCLSCQ